MATLRFSKSFLKWRIVKRSNSPWVGCWFVPSPALMTCTYSGKCAAISAGAPVDLCLTTNMSACIATRLSMVSKRLSPFEVEDVWMSKLITSAESRLAAISKVVLVLVEFSKKRLKTLLPLSSGIFLTSRSGLVTLTNCFAVSRIWRRVSLGKPSKVSKCRSSLSELSCSSPTDSIGCCDLIDDIG